MTEIPADIRTFSGALSDEFFARVEGDGEGEADVIIDLISRAMMRERDRDGWQPIETAPENVAVLIHLPGLDYYGNNGIYAGMLVNMGTGRRWMTFGWAIGRDLSEAPAAWMPFPAPPSPKPAAVSEGGEDE